MAKSPLDQVMTNPIRRGHPNVVSEDLISEVSMVANPKQKGFLPSNLGLFGPSNKATPCPIVPGPQ